MAYEQKDGSGALFKNDKGDNPKRPDYRGDCALNGVQYEIAAWIKDGRNGKFMSLSIKPKEAREPKPEQDKPSGASAGSGGVPTDFDDPLPFAPRLTD